MLRSTLVAAIALSAAFCYAASNVVEQRKAAEAPVEASLRIGLLWHLAHEPMWWAGIFVDVGGFGFQALALSLGSLTFVQPMLVTSLLFSLVLAAAVMGRRPTRAELGWALVLMASLVVFLLVASPHGGADRRPFGAWLPTFVVVGVVVAVCLGVASFRTGATRAALLAAAAGISFGVSSTLMKSFARILADHGPVGVLTSWEPYALGVVIAGGFLVLQSAFQAGDLRAALPAVESLEPVVACLLGLALMHERIDDHGMVTKAVIAACLATLALATVELARASAATREEAGVVDRSPAISEA